MSVTIVRRKEGTRLPGSRIRWVPESFGSSSVVSTLPMAKAVQWESLAKRHHLFIPNLSPGQCECGELMAQPLPCIPPTIVQTSPPGSRLCVLNWRSHTPRRSLGTALSSRLGDPCRNPGCLCKGPAACLSSICSKEWGNIPLHSHPSCYSSTVFTRKP